MPDQDTPAILKYFWFLCAGVMTINTVIFRRRLSRFVERGLATADEANRVIAFVAAWLVGTPLFMGVIELAAGWSSPLCAVGSGFDSVPGLLLSLVSILGGVLLMWWVWRGSGAEVLSRVGPAFSKRPSYDKTYSPKAVRVVVTLIGLAAIFGAAWRPTVPSTPALNCPSATAGQTQAK